RLLLVGQFPQPHLLERVLDGGEALAVVGRRVAGRLEVLAGERGRLLERRDDAAVALRLGLLQGARERGERRVLVGPQLGFELARQAAGERGPLDDLRAAGEALADLPYVGVALL